MRDVRPTPPAKIPTSKPRLNAMGSLGLFQRAARITSSLGNLIGRYSLIVSNARAPW